jgi:hypothetical protein
MLRIIHHRLEPKKTPITIWTDLNVVNSVFTGTIEANMAVKERMVRGFVTVSTKVDR